MQTFHDAEVRALQYVTVSIAKALRAEALRHAPQPLVDRLEAEGRFAADGMNRFAVRIYFGNGLTWVPLVDGLADIQSADGHEASYFARQRDQFAAERYERLRERRSDHQRREDGRERDHNRQLERAWQTDPIARSLFSVATKPEFVKLKPMLQALAREIHAAGQAGAVSPLTDAAVAFIGRERYERIPFAEDFATGAAPDDELDRALAAAEERQKVRLAAEEADRAIEPEPASESAP